MEFWKLMTRLKFLNIRLLVYLLSIAFFSTCAAAFSISRFRQQESRSPWSNRADLLHFQMVGKIQVQGHGNTVGGRRKLLSGLGSSPPRCLGKCGSCTPCKPVHVPVPPGTPVTAEYYPEAWRCKCGNKLYTP